MAGIFLPLLPTTPFLLSATILLTKSNPRVAQWLVENRFLGVYIRSYTQGERLPLRHKARMVLLLWITLLLCGVYLTENLWVRSLLGVVAIAVTAHIVMLRTKNRK